jgi:hypothetical protein
VGLCQTAASQGRGLKTALTVEREVLKLKAERGILKKAAAYFAKHRREVRFSLRSTGTIRAVNWMFGALGVARGWAEAAAHRRRRGDEELSAKVRASFLASDLPMGRGAGLVRDRLNWCHSNRVQATNG